MKYEKYHALGNDYLVLDPAERSKELPADEIVRICHRNFGLGSDGILHGPFPTEEADFALRILNPDGSEAEKSGNGLRIFARYLRDQGKVGSNPFTVHTLGGVVTCEVSEDGSVIAVEMGQVSFRSDVVPVNVEGPVREVLDEPIQAAGQDLRHYAATIGNPHCVVPVEETCETFCRRVGPFLENHPNLHETFWMAAKLCSACKVEVSSTHAQELMDAIEEIHHLFWGVKGREVPWIRAS